MYYKPLWEVLEDLIATATGKIKADLVLKNVSLVNVYSGEIQEEVNIAIKGERIAHVGKKIDHLIGEATRVIDLKGSIVVPGFLDGHIHIESSMLIPSEFARVVIGRGTTSVFADPHEIANVLGVKGVKLMIKNARKSPLKVFIAVPSCVPASTSEFETSGSELNPSDIEELLDLDEVVALGEVMNYPGVISGDRKMMEEIKISLRKKKVIEGHYASPELEEKLSAYVSAGITSCHESTSAMEAIEKARRGMHVMIREGSAWKDLSEVIKAVTEYKLDTVNFSLVSDDRHLLDLIKEGHMDYILRRAVEEGVDPIKAIQMATINTARHFKMDVDIGGIAPGKLADVVVLKDLKSFTVLSVFANGKLVYSDGKLLIERGEPEIPRYAKETVKVKRKLTPEDFKVKVNSQYGEETVKVNVIEVREGSIVTKRRIEKLKVRNGEVQPDLKRGIIKVAVIERHHCTGNMGLGFIKGLHVKEGAIATTIAHDSHNLIVAGVNEEDMALAVNTLIDYQGGITITKNGGQLALVELKVAGLMSDKPYEEVAKEIEELENAWLSISDKKMKAPYMTLSMIALPVIPELRLTDKGLVDVNNFKKTELILKE